MTETTGKALAPMESFMERLKGKLRDDIGDMLPDEVVAGMVQTVINAEFFTKTQKNVGDQYRPKYEEVPTPFQAMVLEAAKPIIEKHALRVMAEHAEQIEAQIAEVVEKGLLTLAIGSIDKMFNDILQSRGWEIQQAVENAMRNRGLAR